jgi:hypothetical protein
MADRERGTSWAAYLDDKTVVVYKEPRTIHDFSIYIYIYMYIHYIYLRDVCVVRARFCCAATGF